MIDVEMGKRDERAVLDDELTLNEVASELQRSRTWVQTIIFKQRRLSAHRKGVQWFVWRKDLEAFKQAPPLTRGKPKGYKVEDTPDEVQALAR